MHRVLAMQQDSTLSVLSDDTRGAQSAMSFGLTVLFAGLLVTMSMTAMTDYVSEKTTDAQRGQAQAVADRTASKVMSADSIATQAPSSDFVLQLGIANDIRSGNIQISLQSSGSESVVRATIPSSNIEREIGVVTMTPITNASVTTGESLYVVYDSGSNTLTLKEQDEL